MSLLDEWEGAVHTYGAGGDTDVLQPVEPQDFAEARSPRRASDSALFSLQDVERQASRGRGQITALAAASDIVVIVTSRAFLIRYDLSQGTAPVAEMELSRAADARASSVWLDPTGSHTVCAVTTASAAEGHYVHAKWQKSRALGKVRGILLSSAAWDLLKGNEASTGDLLLGSTAGMVFEVSLESTDRKEKAVKRVLDLGDVREPIKGLLQLPLPSHRLLILVATPSRLYAFAGSTPLASLFAGYPDPSDLVNYVEFPADGPSLGQLQAFTQPGSAKPERFAWLSEAGVFHGQLDLHRSAVPATELDYLPRRGLLPFPGMASAQGSEAPIALALTEYHYVLLFAARLVIVNRVSESVVQEIQLGARSSLSFVGTPVGLAVDDAASAVFMYTTDGLYEVAAHDETRNMWSIYLHNAQYAEAFKQCRNQAQRDVVRAAEAEALMQAGDPVGAARLWGKMAAATPPFEDIALRLVDCGSPDALHILLSTKLDALPPSDRAQATMVATWLTELYLDQINRALLEEAPEQPSSPTAHPSRPDSQAVSSGLHDGSNGLSEASRPEPAGESQLVKALTKRLREFLAKRVEVLDRQVTVTLLASYGRLDDLMHYAALRQDAEAVLELLVQRGEARKALAVLRQPNLSTELIYKFAPPLMAAAPAETVDAWMAVQPPLDPRRLLPALLRWGEMGAPPTARAHALRYVQFCIAQLASTDAALHNLAVALYCGEDEEGPLLQYLSSARNPLGRPLYDAQYALRLVRQRSRMHASVALFCELSMFEDAVELALRIDRSAAVAVANRPEDDPQLQRKLWLAIAKHLICTASDANAPGQSIAQVNEFLRETGGLVKIEDILPLFPDFVQIDAFKDAICQSLEDYNQHIDQLKSEMADATRIADALRRDMATLEHRTGTLDLATPCARCHRPLSRPPPPAAGLSGGCIPALYLFPTGNAFHGACAAAEVASLVAPAQAARIKALLARLAKVPEGSEDVPAAADAPAVKVAQLQAQLEAEIAGEDPFSGELVLRHLDRPFIQADEQSEMASWHI